jgi:glycosyltransferase involved in cell wall biosynthesis
MAAGVPVVATRSGAIPETVKDQQTGFLVDKGDSRALATSIVKLLQDDALRAKMGRAARAWVHEHFVWDRVAAVICKHYSDLSRGTPSHSVEYTPDAKRFAASA